MRTVEMKNLSYFGVQVIESYFVNLRNTFLPLKAEQELGLVYNHFTITKGSDRKIITNSHYYNQLYNPVTMIQAQNHFPLRKKS